MGPLGGTAWNMRVPPSSCGHMLSRKKWRVPASGEKPCVQMGCVRKAYLQLIAGGIKECHTKSTCTTIVLVAPHLVGEPHPSPRAAASFVLAIHAHRLLAEAPFLPSQLQTGQQGPIQRPTKSTASPSDAARLLAQHPWGWSREHTTRRLASGAWPAASLTLNQKQAREGQPGSGWQTRERLSHKLLQRPSRVCTACRPQVWKHHNQEGRLDRAWHGHPAQQQGRCGARGTPCSRAIQPRPLGPTGPSHSEGCGHLVTL